LRRPELLFAECAIRWPPCDSEPVLWARFADLSVVQENLPFGSHMAATLAVPVSRVIFTDEASLYPATAVTLDKKPPINVEMKCPSVERREPV
jgi:hypothetical protein